VTGDGNGSTVGEHHLPNLDNLAVCREHGVMTHTRDGRGVCPLCKLDVDVEVRRDDKISSGENLPPGRLSQMEIAQRIESEAMQELLPLMEEYLNDKAEADDEGDLWVTVARVADGQLPAGYSKAQERWANVVAFTLSGRVKYVSTEPNAEETIESLKEAGYGSE